MTLQDVSEQIACRFALTSTEKQILCCILMGYDNESISKEVYCAVKTVKNHITHIISKSKMNRKKLQALALLMCCDDQEITVVAYMKKTLEDDQIKQTEH
jgi:DNA-binding NarL/FixJ family response regulator